MEQWQQILQSAVTDPAVIAKRFELSEEVLRRVSETFRFRVTKNFLSLIREKGDGIYRQCIPDPAELEDDPDLMTDPLGEGPHALVPGVLVKRYPDRCMLFVSGECASYCRFCTRKRRFGQTSDFDPARVEEGIDCIGKHPELRDVLVSGGDPFLLPDDRLEHILGRLRAIPHVEIIRIGTRTPSFLPERITVKLVRMLKKYHPLYVNVHFNHPAELVPKSISALERLANAGVPLGCQTVLLKGVNDAPAVLKELFQKLLKARVKPYYLFQCDLVYGTRHFRTPLQRGIDLIDALQCWTTGMAVPRFMVDLPGGFGKVGFSPEHRIGSDGRTIHFKNYRGELCDYRDVADEP